jgi:septal ring factor EnvC (AmiA/AmiB activator)
VDLTHILIFAVISISFASLIYIYSIKEELKKQAEFLKNLQDKLTSLEKDIENNKVESKKILESYKTEIKEEQKKQAEFLRNLQDKLISLERNVENNKIETNKMLEIYKTELKNDINKVETLLSKPIDIHELIKD